MTNAEQVGLPTTQPEMTFEKMLNGIGDCQSDNASSDDEEDGEDENDDEEDPERGKLTDDNKPGWVMGIVCKMVQLQIECFR